MPTNTDSTVLSLALACVSSPGPEARWQMLSRKGMSRRRKWRLLISRRSGRPKVRFAR